jgi:hypothetical protein
VDVSREGLQLAVRARAWLACLPGLCCCLEWLIH